MRTLVLNGHFEKAAKHCVQVELQPEAFSVSENDMSVFYSQYLSLLLVIGDVEEARYLWLRAPDSVKSGSAIFDAVWNIGKCLYDKDSAGAHAAISSASFPQEVQVVVNELSVRMRHAELAVIGKVYSRILLVELATRLGMPSSAGVLGAAELARSIGWKVDEQAGEVEVDLNKLSASSLKGANSSGGTRSKGLANANSLSPLLVQKLSKFVAHFETKPLTVDVNAVTKTATASATTATTTAAAAGEGAGATAATV